MSRSTTWAGPEGAISTREAIEHGVEICMKKVVEGGGRPILVAADASDEQAVDQMFGQVLNEYGRLDILVNNAGIQIAGDSDEAAYITGQTLFVDGGRAGDRRTARPVDRIASNGSSCRIVIPPVTATRGAGRDDPWSRRGAPGVTPAAL